MKKWAIVYLMLAGSLAMTACGGNNSSQMETAAESAAETGEEKRVGGRVASVSNEEIVVAVRSGGPGKPGGQPDQQGQPGSRPGRQQEQPGAQSGQSSLPADQNAGEEPSAEQEGSQNTADGQPQAEEETVTIPLTAETEVVDSEGNARTVSDIQEGDFVFAELGSDGTAQKITVNSAEGEPGGGPGRAPGGPDGNGGPGGSSDQSGKGGPDGGAGPEGGAQTAPTSYQAVTEFSSDTEEAGNTYASTGTDENAVHITGGTVTLRDFSLTRTSQESTGGDTSSFYGVGAGILVSGGTARLSGGTITTDARGGAGIFSYGQGAVNVSDTKITTSQDTSGGIHVAGGGTLHAENLTVETAGESSAAIRSDRGGGTMTVTGGTYTSNGTGSPAVYCTADITISDAVLTANNSEAVCIEGLNSLTLTNCDLTGAIPENEQNDCNWTVILYQSMSGDSEVGNSTFTMDGGSLTSKNGGMFYTTNTESTFYLKKVDLTYSASHEFFLKCTGNANKRGWGQSGANGADCSFTADQQEMEGDVIWDSISTLDFQMTNQSRLTGAFLQEEANAGNGGNGTASLTIDATSSWIVTGDSRLSDLQNAGTIQDADGNTVSIVGSDGTVYVEGSSPYTVTTDSYRAAAA